MTTLHVTILILFIYEHISTHKDNYNIILSMLHMTEYEPCEAHKVIMVNFLFSGIVSIKIIYPMKCLFSLNIFH